MVIDSDCFASVQTETSVCVICFRWEKRKGVADRDEDSD